MRHQTISFVKSAIRIAGYAAILGAWYLHISYLWWSAVLLIASEVVGIAEEIGHE